MMGYPGPSNDQLRGAVTVVAIAGGLALLLALRHDNARVDAPTDATRGRGTYR